MFLGNGPEATKQSRLAFFLPTLDAGGAERALVALAAGLSQAGAAVHLVVGSATTGDLRDDVPADLEIVDLRRAHVRRSIGALAGYLRDVRPTCLLSTLDHANVAALMAVRAARTSTPTIVRVANTLSEVWRQVHGPDKWTLRVIRRAYRHADAIVTPAAHVATDLAAFANLDQSTIRVIPNPVIGPQFAAQSAAALTDPWFLPEQPPVILGVGRFVAQKHFDLLVQAFHLVRADVDARLLILGDGPERGALERLVKDLDLVDQVRLPGYECNPLRFMAGAEVVASSSTYEGSPAVLIQALACNAKVVATDCPGGSSDILGGGAYGRLVPSDDAAALATALKAALAEPRRANDPRSWGRYTLANSVRSYRELIQEVTNQPRAVSGLIAS